MNLSVLTLEIKIKEVEKGATPSLSTKYTKNLTTDCQATALNNKIFQTFKEEIRVGKNKL